MSCFIQVCPTSGSHYLDGEKNGGTKGHAI